MKLYRERDIRKLKKDSYEFGLNTGYRLGYKMWQVEKNNKDMVNNSLLKSPLSTNILRDLNDAGDKL